MIWEGPVSLPDLGPVEEKFHNLVQVTASLQRMWGKAILVPGTGIPSSDALNVRITESLLRKQAYSHFAPNLSISLSLNRTTAEQLLENDGHTTYRTVHNRNFQMLGVNLECSTLERVYGAKLTAQSRALLSKIRESGNDDTNSDIEVGHSLHFEATNKPNSGRR